MVPWWFSSIVLMCFARCAVTRRPSPAARSTPLIHYSKIVHCEIKVYIVMNT